MRNCDDPTCAEDEEGNGFWGGKGLVYLLAVEM